MKVPFIENRKATDPNLKVIWMFSILIFLIFNTCGVLSTTSLNPTFQFNFTFIQTTDDPEWELQSSSSGGDPIWSGSPTYTGHPGRRADFCSAGDGERFIYIFGGSVYCDLWIFDTTLSRWNYSISDNGQITPLCTTRMTPPVYPGRVYGGMGLYHNDSFYVIMGKFGDYRNSVWKWSVHSRLWEWVEIEPGWTESNNKASYSAPLRPGGRSGHVATLDGSRLIVFSGTTYLDVNTNRVSNDIWTLDLDNPRDGWTMEFMNWAGLTDFDVGDYNLSSSSRRPMARYLATGWFYKDHLYTIGGWTPGADWIIGDMWKYSFSRKVWDYVDLRSLDGSGNPVGDMINLGGSQSYPNARIGSFQMGSAVLINNTVFFSYKSSQLWMFDLNLYQFFMITKQPGSYTSTSDSYSYPCNRARYYTFIANGFSSETTERGIFVYGGKGLGVDSAISASLGDMWKITDPLFFDGPFCFGVHYTDNQTSCSTHGACVGNDICACDSPYYGKNCSDYSCGGVDWLSSGVCSGYGACISPGICSCKEDHFGEDCEVNRCFGIWSNETSGVCSDHGNCELNFTCSCNDGYIGSNCSIHMCFGIPFYDLTACSGHGICKNKDLCECDTNFMVASDCSVWSCFSILSNDSYFVCSGHGVCDGVDSCKCNNLLEYEGSNCQNIVCHNVSSALVDDVCYGHGNCYEIDKCFCQSGYSNEYIDGPCSLWKCGKYQKDNSAACSGRGKCVESQKCSCDDYYHGEECETWNCNGVDKNDENRVCGGNGECTNPEKCECNAAYTGKHCGTNLLYVTVMAPTLTIAFVVVALLVGSGICLCCLLISCAIILCLCLCAFSVFYFLTLSLKQKGGLKRFSQLKNFDLHLKEQQLENDTSIAHLRINQRLFEIPFEELETKGILGEGGSSSIVFRALCFNVSIKIRRGRTVAFKCFKTRTICSTQEKYDEFEREVEILSSLSHPSVIRFFGCTMNPPRVGIVMEFCEKGEFGDFIKKYREENGIGYPNNSKITILHEVASAMEYLHSRNIIHRDIKTENVLIDEHEHAKLMDFGLSRLVESMSVQKTLRIGTNVYMSPEVINDGHYTEKCDVFSMAIMIFIILTENFHPYGSNEFKVEFRVAADIHFRPNISQLSKVLEEEEKWIIEVVEKCWDHKPENRYSFEELSEIFKGDRESKKFGTERTSSVVEPLSVSAKNETNYEEMRSEVISLKEKLGDVENKNVLLEEEIVSLKKELKKSRESLSRLSSESESESDD